MYRLHLHGIIIIFIFMVWNLFLKHSKKSKKRQVCSALCIQGQCSCASRVSRHSALLPRRLIKFNNPALPKLVHWNYAYVGFTCVRSANCVAVALGFVESCKDIPHPFAVHCAILEGGTGINHSRDCVSLLLSRERAKLASEYSCFSFCLTQRPHFNTHKEKMQLG